MSDLLATADSWEWDTFHPDYRRKKHGWLWRLIAWLA